jgi:hypothetical protein
VKKYIGKDEDNEIGSVLRMIVMVKSKMEILKDFGVEKILEIGMMYVEKKKKGRGMEIKIMRKRMEVGEMGGLREKKGE